MKMAESSPTGREQCGKKRLLFTSNFSFSHSVFKGFELQTLRNHALFGKGLNCRLVGWLYWGLTQL